VVISSLKDFAVTNSLTACSRKLPTINIQPTLITIKGGQYMQTQWGTTGWSQKDLK